MKVTLEDGREVTFEPVSKTKPIADKDYPCCIQILPPHTIPKGSRYVRLVNKVDGEFRSDHICFECWFLLDKAENENGTKSAATGERHRESDQ